MRYLFVASRLLGYSTVHHTLGNAQARRRFVLLMLDTIRVMQTGRLLGGAAAWLGDFRR